MLTEKQQKFLNEIEENGAIFIVEGKNDKKALEKFNIKNILEISGKQLEEVSDIVKNRGGLAVILTDYDGEGVKQYNRLKKLLITNDIRIDDDIRRNFKRTFLINKIEELNGYFK